jgi:hypothetical protein
MVCRPAALLARLKELPHVSRIGGPPSAPQMTAKSPLGPAFKRAARTGKTGSITSIVKPLFSVKILPSALPTCWRPSRTACPCRRLDAYPVVGRNRDGPIHDDGPVQAGRAASIVMVR